MIDQTQGWGTVGDEAPGFKYEEPVPGRDELPPGMGFKKCVVCGAMVVYTIIKLPNALLEWRTFCPRCRFLERFTMPACKGLMHTKRYENAPGFMYFYWEFIEHR
jgi:hypothetical protein